MKINFKMVAVLVKSHWIHAWSATKFLLTFWAIMYGIAGHAMNLEYPKNNFSSYLMLVPEKLLDGDKKHTPCC